MDRHLFIINEDSEHNETTSKETRSILNKKYSNFNKEPRFEQFSEQKQKNKYINKTVTFNINYLNFNAQILDSEEKNREYEKIIQTYCKLHSKEFGQIQSEKVKKNLKNHRNPNVENLIKDLKEKSNDTLKDDLKKEFNLFIDQSVSKSSQSLKHYSNSEPKKKTSNTTFLTEIEETYQKTDNRDQDSSKSKLSVKNILTDEICILAIDGESNQKIIEKANTLENSQIAIIGSEENSLNLANSSLIKLKKMLESIKRIDLPKFQNEIHQVCQYGTDPQLFKLYPQNFETEINEMRNGLGRYCIHECCIKGNVNMLKALLPYIYDINKVDQNKQNAAHIAAKFGELECLKILTANKISLEEKDGLGMQPSHLAARYNHVDIIKFLFELGVRLDCRCFEGKTPFHYAAEYGSFEALKFLSECFVDYSVTDNDGNTLAHLTVKNDHLMSLKYLVKLGLPVDKCRNKLGRNVLHMCCASGAIRSLHWLLENKFDYLAVDNSGNNLGHLCCLYGQAECLNCCIQHDIPINKVNNFGENPFELARKAGKALRIEKAATNQIRCENCVKNALRVKWEKDHDKTIAEKDVEKKLNRIYSMCPIGDNTLIKNKTIMRKLGINIAESNSNKKNEKRDSIAQYFGPEI